MELTLRRLKMKPGKSYTIGHLYIDGKYCCDTIEDVDRGLTQDMPREEILKIKIKSLTAIPKGRYKILMNTVSPSFSKKIYYKNFCKGIMPRLWNVPGFEGILIHKGTTEKDSAGCLCVGYNTVVGQLTDSRRAFESLYQQLKQAHNKGEAIYITIK